MKAKWIWANTPVKKDEYCEFKTKLYCRTGNLKINIAADTDYVIYINDKYIESGQYASYPYAPVMDVINKKVKKGNNTIKIIVHHNGNEDFSTYYKDLPGLYLEVYDEDELILVSDENLKSALSETYINHQEIKISPQLGYTFTYDANNETKKIEFLPSVEIIKNTNFTVRENQKLVIKQPVKTNIIKSDKLHYLIDLNKEQTGFIRLDFVSEYKQKVIIAFGEHINDGCVRKIIGNRTFTFEYIAKPGNNNFTSYLRRFGCRYLEVFLEYPIDINYIGLVPTVYPFKLKKFNINNPLERKIYKTCIYTLQCCYHEHYEDCPWREQAFYSLDSRNQMLSGYYVFENREQVRSAIKLISLDNRNDGLLSICYPSGFDLTIPSFSLHFFTAVYEYYKHTQDIKLIKEIYPKLQSIIDAFIKRVNEDLFIKFNQNCHWNFYEWKEGLDYPSGEDKTDLIINCLLIIALKNMAKISKILNISNNYIELANKISKKTNKEFYNKKDKLYFMSNLNKTYSVLGNSLAILSGVANKEKSIRIAKVLTSSSKLTPVTLSMKCFLYDALLKVDSNYKKYIRNDIKVVYKKMLDNGATTFWETELGEKDFDNAGSLCHGWSALPIYYYNLFNIVKTK